MKCGHSLWNVGNALKVFEIVNPATDTQLVYCQFLCGGVQCPVGSENCKQRNKKDHIHGVFSFRGTTSLQDWMTNANYSAAGTQCEWLQGQSEFSEFA